MFAKVSSFLIELLVTKKSGWILVRIKGRLGYPRNQDDLMTN
jgi:hypothetical protein